MKKIQIGQTYNLDLGSLCPVALIPIEFLKTEVRCRYLHSYNNRVENLPYELFEINGYSK